MTLLELVIAMSVFAIIAGGIATVGWSGLTLSSNSRDRSTAANLASEDLDEVQAMDFDDLAAEINTVIPAETITVGSKPFTGAARRCNGRSRTAPPRSATSPAARKNWVVQVTTLVSWPDKPSVMPPAEATTIVSPPVGFGRDTTDGSIPVTVLDAEGEGVPNVPISATDGGSNTYTATTDSNGCGFLLVDPATYTVSLSLAGYVGRDGTTDPQTVVTVSPGGNVAVAFDYDRAGSIDLTTLLPTGLSDATVPTGIPVTLSYQFFSPTGSRTYTTSTFPAVVSGLFPDSYGLWAGDCEDADPQGVFWSGGLGQRAGHRAGRWIGVG